MANEQADRILAALNETDLGYAAQLASVVAEREMTDDDAKELLSTFRIGDIEANIDFLRKVEKLCKYEGFNPREIAFSLLEKHKATKALVTADPERNKRRVIGSMSDGSVIEITNNMEFKEDMQFLCLIFITRGSAYDKILRKSNEFVRGVMDMMKGKYGINTAKRGAGRPLDSTTITIPRISASFPALTVDLFDRKIGRPIVDPSIIFPGVELPRALFSPMASSMLPEHVNSPKAVMVAIAIAIDDVLHPMDQKTSLQNIYTYFMASYTSTAMTKFIKIEYCKKWGIINADLRNRTTMANFTYKVEIIDARVPALQFISRSRPNDPYLQALTNLL